VEGILTFCRDTLKVDNVTAALYTHRHFDHTGGHIPKAMTGGREVTVQGLHTFVEKGVPVAVGRADTEAVSKQSRVDMSVLRALDDGDTVEVGGDGGAVISTLSTPGHTTGSICLQLHGSNSSVLFTGDTLFIGSCGRYDLPESDVRALLASLDRLSKLPRDTLVLPGHNYAAPAHTTIGAESEMNDMMIQAMGLVKSGKIAPSRVAASLALPDYLGVAERLAVLFRTTAPIGELSDVPVGTDGDCGHAHEMLPFFSDDGPCESCGKDQSLHSRL
jgi:glyoxylase-like metal-dependent hydrolase (beta-lactamase superfamily II)